MLLHVQDGGAEAGGGGQVRVGGALHPDLQATRWLLGGPAGQGGGGGGKLSAEEGSAVLATSRAGWLCWLLLSRHQTASINSNFRLQSLPACL